jgi:hypothetical protein
VLKKAAIVAGSAAAGVLAVVPAANADVSVSVLNGNQVKTPPVQVSCNPITAVGKVLASDTPQSTSCSTNG